MSEEKKDIHQKNNEEAPATADASEAQAPEVKKGDSRMPKRTEAQAPGECAGCAKPIRKRLWYYKSGAFFCTRKCYTRKLEADKKKAEEAASK